jgi:hypothetical protein
MLLIRYSKGIYWIRIALFSVTFEVKSEVDKSLGKMVSVQE